MIQPSDISAAMDAARAATDSTDAVCGSTSLPEYRQHMNLLEEARDALATVENELKKAKDDKESQRDQAVNAFNKEISAFAHDLREVARLKKKLDDHWERTKATSNDLRFGRTRPTDDVLTASA